MFHELYLSSNKKVIIIILQKRREHCIDNSNSHSHPLLPRAVCRPVQKLPTEFLCSYGLWQHAVLTWCVTWAYCSSSSPALLWTSVTITPGLKRCSRSRDNIWVHHKFHFQQKQLTSMLFKIRKFIEYVLTIYVYIQIRMNSIQTLTRQSSLWLALMPDLK